MHVDFAIRRGDVLFRGNFGSPVFTLFHEPGKLHAHVFSALSQYGLRPADMKQVGGDGSLGDTHLRCSFLASRVTLKVSIEGFELSLMDPTTDDVAYLKGLATSTIQTLERVAETRFNTYALSVSLHGVLRNTDLRQYLRTFAANAPDDLGPEIGNGAAFYYGAKDPQITAFVTVDVSALVESGLFFRSHAVWQSHKIQTEALGEMAAEHVRLAMSKVGLAIAQEPR